MQCIDIIVIWFTAGEDRKLIFYSTPFLLKKQIGGFLISYGVRKLEVLKGSMNCNGYCQDNLLELARMLGL